MSVLTSEQTPLDDGARDKRPGRIALEVPIRLRSSDGSGGSYAAVTKNVCAGGIFVATARSLPAGDRVTVVLMIPGDPDPVEAVAEVRWCRPLQEPSDRPPGMGLRFVDTPLRAAMLVNELRSIGLRTRAPGFPRDDRRAVR